MRVQGELCKPSRLNRLKRGIFVTAAVVASCRPSLETTPSTWGGGGRGGGGGGELRCSNERRDAKLPNSRALVHSKWYVHVGARVPEKRNPQQVHGRQRVASRHPGVLGDRGARSARGGCREQQQHPLESSGGRFRRWHGRRRRRERQHPGFHHGEQAPGIPVQDTYFSIRVRGGGGGG